MHKRKQDKANKNMLLSLGIWTEVHSYSLCRAALIKSLTAAATVEN